ncbi:right-handed parallel beta-helix repeat-containing protein [Tunicatimonas pelagia]|uniref:right-handed parallel beta-helix repeat-containing protein n=1 Tax=Tunicatimonas pelagia TaxID=931531 RepID=UPI002664FFDE|nr:right-handed parallel beta-helix repeat-containing protein [Tunicatimonas pelagia]WKN44867.1 right-handed parallel beta-helix repeat-containing protein [Tunicatimonas pelagia]
MTYAATLLFTLLALTPTTVFGQLAFYVSPEGNDGNEGTEVAPFRTVRRAQQAVQTVQNARQNIVVQIDAGSYLLEEPLRFGPEDGGSANHQVTYRGSDKGKVVIHSGRKVSGWQESDEVDVYQAKVVDAAFRQLYVNGRRAVRARYPNEGEFLESTAWDYEDQELLIQGQHPVLNEAGPDLEMLLLQSWAESYLRVREVHSYGLSFQKYSRVSFAENESKILFNRPYPMHEPIHRLYFENARSLLDTEREWYHDPANGALYYQPGEEGSMNQASVMCPTLDTLLIVQGTRENPVMNLRFENLSFQYSNWTYASEHGYLNAQAGQHNYRAEPNNDQYVYRPPAAVYVAYAERVAFARNEFRNLGATGIDLHYGTRHCTVVGNRFSDIAGSAVALAKFTEAPSVEYHMPYQPADTTEICYGDTITNNLIERVARDYVGCVGIAAGYPQGAQITHNTIRDLPYSGISVGYGWTDQPNAMANNLIAYNDISNVVKLLNDGAAIYTLSYQPGTRIYRNYLHDLSPPQKPWQSIKYAIYCDEKTGGSAEHPFVIEENAIDNIADQLNLHQTGIILLKHALHRTSQHVGPQVVKQAGIEPGYQDILSPPASIGRAEE